MVLIGLFKTGGIFFHPIQSLRCGTTGVVTFIRGNMLHVAWLGDSQVMLVRRGQAVELMKPHKPDREVRIACFNHSRAAFTTEADRYQLLVGCWDAERCLADVSWSGSVCSSSWFVWKLVWICMQILCSHLVGSAASTILCL